MKKEHKSLLWISLALLTAMLTLPAQAQDDLYYNPATDRVTRTTTTTTTTVEDNYEPSSGVTRRYDNEDGYAYEDEDDYAYEYSSRVRRFHRPVRTMDYYDPMYVDLWNYDPFFQPGASIYTYGFNDYWTWRRWRRWQRWNSWNAFDMGWGNTYGWNNWGWGGYRSGGWGMGWNSWNTPFVVNNYYYDPYWTWNGWNPYCSNNGWGNNYNNNWNNGGSGWNNGNGNGGYVPKTYTGVRRHGSTVNQGFARINDNGRARLAPNTKGGEIIEMKARPSARTALDNNKNPNATERSLNGRQPSSANPDSDVRGRTRANEQVGRAPENARPGRDTDGARPGEEVRSNRTARPNTEDVRPGRSTAELRPTRHNTNEDGRPW